MLMCVYVKRSHTMWKNSLLIGNKVENEGLGACPQNIFLRQRPLEYRETPFSRIELTFIIDLHAKKENFSNEDQC